jgi:AraC family transcriptional activator FtrA
MANPLVACLLYDDLCTFEMGIAVEIFGLPRPELGPNWYRFLTCAVEPGRPLGATGGLRMMAEAGLEAIEQAGTVVIPGWRGGPASPALVAALRAAHDRGARLVSICSGAFLLAEACLLDGRRVTTHWRYAAELKARHPALRVEPDVLYIDEGRLLTSAGSAAGIDLCLHLVRRDHGPEVANQVARRLVVPPHRNGGQAQFVERPVPHRPDSRLAALISALEARLEQPATVAEMAGMAAMSERTFVRRFREATGQSPGDWLVCARVERARELLETGAASIEDVARLSGFGGPPTLRHHFRRKLGVSPGEYRARFARSAA